MQHPTCTYLISVLLLLLPRVSTVHAQDVIIYTKAGEKIAAQLLYLSDLKVTFDPEGDLEYRALNLAAVDSIVTVEESPQLLFPPSGGKPVNLIVPPSTVPSRFERSGICLAFSVGARRAVTFFKINFLVSGNQIVPLNFRMGDGYGVGSSLYVFSPVSESGICLGGGAEVSSFSASLGTEVEPGLVFESKCTLLSVDGFAALKFPLSGKEGTMFFTFGLGAGLRRFSANKPDENIGENDAAFIAIGQLEWFAARTISIAFSAKAWNSTLQGLPDLDLPRYTAIELHGGLCFYF